MARAGLHFVFEDDVVLHEQWRPMLLRLLKHAEAAAAAEAASEREPVECVLLDGLFMAGDESAGGGGWLGPLEEGAHRARGVCFSSAYAITPRAAAWLLARRAERPHSNAEAYLMQLQEERGRAWTHMPRLAVQRWDEAASSVSALDPAMMRRWYEDNYFVRYPSSLYHPPDEDGG